MTLTCYVNAKICGLRGFDHGENIDQHNKICLIKCVSK